MNCDSPRSFRQGISDASSHQHSGSSGQQGGGNQRWSKKKSGQGGGGWQGSAGVAHRLTCRAGIARPMPPVSAFRHSSFHSGTGLVPASVLLFIPLPTWPDAGQSGILKISLKGLREVAHQGSEKLRRCSSVQQGAAQINRVQPCSVGCSVA